MPVQITCPNCRGPLRVPEDLFGKRVQCPTCESIFVAEIETPPPQVERPTVRPVADEPFPYERERREPRPDGRYLQPHRGNQILTFGILSLVICAPLGIAAWVMGNTDLAAIKRGEMDPSGEGNTQAGRVCGIIGTALMGIGCGCGGLAFLAEMMN